MDALLHAGFERRLYSASVRPYDGPDNEAVQENLACSALCIQCGSCFPLAVRLWETLFNPNGRVAGDAGRPSNNCHAAR